MSHPQRRSLFVRRLRSLLLLGVILAFGGSTVGVPAVEIEEAEGECQARLELTHARRFALSSHQLQRLRQVGEVRSCQAETECQPGTGPQWLVDWPMLESQYWGPPSPSRAPPPVV